MERSAQKPLQIAKGILIDRVDPVEAPKFFQLKCSTSGTTAEAAKCEQVPVCLGFPNPTIPASQNRLKAEFLVKFPADSKE